MPLKDALLTLAGDDFYLLVDPIHRLIAFRIRFAYEHLYSGHRIVLTGDMSGGDLS